MTTGTDWSDRLDGQSRSLDAAVGAVLSTRDSLERDAVRSTLERIATDAEVTAGSIEAAVEAVAQTIDATAASIDEAADALERARETTAPVDDVALVETTLAEGRSDLDGLEATLADQRERLEDVRQGTGSGEGLYDLASDLSELEDDAATARTRASELLDQLEHLASWVDDPAQKLAELETDAEEIDGDLDEIQVTRGHVEAVLAEPGTVGDGDGDALVAWSNAIMRVRMLGLAIEDIRAELAAVETVAQRTDADVPDASDLESRLEEIADRQATTLERLEDLERPSWTGRFETMLWSFEETIDDAEPPVDWGTVRNELERHRTAIFQSVV